jgi:hypothetical protein
VTKEHLRERYFPIPIFWMIGFVYSHFLYSQFFGSVAVNCRVFNIVLAIRFMPPRLTGINLTTEESVRCQFLRFPSLVPIL